MCVSFILIINFIVVSNVCLCCSERLLFFFHCFCHLLMSISFWSLCFFHAVCVMTCLWTVWSPIQHICLEQLSHDDTNWRTSIQNESSNRFSDQHSCLNRKAFIPTWHHFRIVWWYSILFLFSGGSAGIPFSFRARAGRGCAGSHALPHFLFFFHFWEPCAHNLDNWIRQYNFDI